MRTDDLRLERSTGNYETREELVRVVLHKAKVMKMSHKNIGEQVGVSAATVTRIINDDHPQYKAARSAVDELPSTKLNRFWRITEKPEETTQ